jgi:hypothetical protein
MDEEMSKTQARRLIPKLAFAGKGLSHRLIGSTPTSTGFGGASIC